MTRVLAVVPPVPALLPAYTGGTDAVPDLRKSTLEAVAWLAEHSPDRIVVLGDDPETGNVSRGVETSLASRVAAHLLAEVGFSGEVASELDTSSAGVLVLANGSARRGEKAPGHLDSRALEHDALIEQALASGDLPTLIDIDTELGSALLASGTVVVKQVAGSVAAVSESTMLYADDPFGVRYWVVTWQCGF